VLVGLVEVVEVDATLVALPVLVVGLRAVVGAGPRLGESGPPEGMAEVRRAEDVLTVVFLSSESDMEGRTEWPAVVAVLLVVAAGLRAVVVEGRAGASLSGRAPAVEAPAGFWPVAVVDAPGRRGAAAPTAGFLATGFSSGVAAGSGDETVEPLVDGSVCASSWTGTSSTS
jgi:hypothetical protein